MVRVKTPRAKTKPAQTAMEDFVRQQLQQLTPKQQLRIIRSTINVLRVKTNEDWDNFVAQFESPFTVVYAIVTANMVLNSLCLVD